MIKYPIAKIFLVPGYFFFLLLFQQCSNSSGPVTNKDPADYSWTIDTLKNSYVTELHKIWGSSGNDIYVCGYSRDATKPPLWHFNGEEWANVKLPVDMYFINDIFGFSNDNVWAVGYTNFNTIEGVILHFDGMSWEKISINVNTNLTSIWGYSADDIWIGGDSRLLHFDGVQWQDSSISFLPTDKYGKGNAVYSLAGLSKNDVYSIICKTQTLTPFETVPYYLAHFNGTDWNLTDSTYFYSQEGKYGINLRNIDGQLYSSCYRAFKKKDANWELFNGEKNILSVGGNSSKNIFAVGSYGFVSHFNGATWNTLKIGEILKYEYVNVWANETEVFLLAGDGMTTYILHGR